MSKYTDTGGIFDIMAITVIQTHLAAAWRPEIQAFTGSLVGLGASKGVFVTTSAFSPQAIEFASKIPQRVILIDGKRLTELMIEHTVDVRCSRVLEFKRLDEDFFSDD